MRKEKRPAYQPGEKVIRFDTSYGGDEGPRLAWVAAERFYPSISTHDGIWNVSVSCSEKEAANGYGVFVRAPKLQPYSDELWAACERWNAEREALRARLKLLARGAVGVGRVKLLGVDKTLDRFLATTGVVGTPPELFGTEAEDMKNAG